jgi:hypothetical protein
MEESGAAREELRRPVWIRTRWRTLTRQTAWRETQGRRRIWAWAWEHPKASMSALTSPQALTPVQMPVWQKAQTWQAPVCVPQFGVPRLCDPPNPLHEAGSSPQPFPLLKARSSSELRPLPDQRPLRAPQVSRVPWPSAELRLSLARALLRKKENSSSVQVPHRACDLASQAMPSPDQATSRVQGPPRERGASRRISSLPSSRRSDPASDWPRDCLGRRPWRKGGRPRSLFGVWGAWQEGSDGSHAATGEEVPGIGADGNVMQQRAPCNRRFWRTRRMRMRSHGEWHLRSA